MYVSYPLQREVWLVASENLRKKYKKLIDYQEAVQNLNNAINTLTEEPVNHDAEVNRLLNEKNRYLSSARTLIQGLIEEYRAQYYLPEDIAYTMAAEYSTGIDSFARRLYQDYRNGEYRLKGEYRHYDDLYAAFESRLWRRTARNILDEIREFILDYDAANDLAKIYDMSAALRRYLNGNYSSYLASVLKGSIEQIELKDKRIKKRIRERKRTAAIQKRKDFRAAHKNIRIPKKEMSRLPTIDENFDEIANKLGADAQVNHDRCVELASMYRGLFDTMADVIGYKNDAFEHTMKDFMLEELNDGKLSYNRNICTYERFITQEEYDVAYYIFARIDCELRDYKNRPAGNSISVHRAYEYLKQMLHMQGFYNHYTTIRKVKEFDIACIHVSDAADYDPNHLANEFQKCVRNHLTYTSYKLPSDLLPGLSEYSDASRKLKKDAKSFYMGVYILCMNYRMNDLLAPEDSISLINNFASACATLLHTFTYVYYYATRLDPLVHKYIGMLKVDDEKAKEVKTFICGMTLSTYRNTKRNPPIHRGRLDYMPQKAIDVIDERDPYDFNVDKMSFEELSYSTAIINQYF